jgi:hypothetical protein
MIRRFRLQFGLPIPALLTQNDVMENEADKPVGLRGLFEWATTRPQAYLTYFLAVVLIGGMSFYAGTLKRQLTSPSPPAVSAPRN